MFRYISENCNHWKSCSESKHSILNVKELYQKQPVRSYGIQTHMDPMEYKSKKVDKTQKAYKVYIKKSQNSLQYFFLNSSSARKVLEHKTDMNLGHPPCRTAAFRQYDIRTMQGKPCRLNYIAVSSWSHWTMEN